MSLTTDIFVNIFAERRTQEIYKSKCVRPRFNDFLNFVYDIQDDNQHDFASMLHQAWKKDDATFGLIIRERIKHCFLEVAEIEADEEKEEYQRLNAISHRLSDLMRERTPSSVGDSR